MLNIRIMLRGICYDVMDIVVAFPPADAQSANEICDDDANDGVDLKIVRDAHVASIMDCEDKLVP